MKLVEIKYMFGEKKILFSWTLEILEMIREIGPDSIYPTHTRDARAFNVLREEGIEVDYAKVKMSI